MRVNCLVRAASPCAELGVLRRHLRHEGLCAAEGQGAPLRLL
ncbi:hypothetical protein ACFXGR_56870 [Streptomyces mirabilis]